MINSNDIDMILNQFKSQNRNVPQSERRLNWDYTLPVTFGPSRLYIEAESRDGNVVSIEVFSISEKQVGVRLRTLWN